MPLKRKLGVWLLSLASFSGCHQIRDCVDREVDSCCNRHQANMAWLECRWNYVDCQPDYICDFGHGFRQGYADVAAGGDGCVPALPARKYWGPCYKTPEGHAAVVAWFDGYQHGAAVAMADGANAYGRIPTSDQIYRKNCRIPVSLDLEQYKAKNGVGGSPQAPMDGNVPPLPDVDPGEIPKLEPSEPYSPEVKPQTPLLEEEAPAPADAVEASFRN